jgi:hypothetical protein
MPCLIVTFPVRELYLLYKGPRTIILLIFMQNDGVEQSPRNAGPLKAGRSEVDFCSNDLLAPCESAHGAFSHHLFLSFSLREKQIGRAEPVGDAQLRR